MNAQQGGPFSDDEDLHRDDTRMVRDDNTFPGLAEHIRRCLHEVGLTPEQVERVTQQVWLALLENRHLFEGEHAEQQLHAWVDRVAHGKAMDEHRRARRERRLFRALDALRAEPKDRREDAAEQAEVTQHWCEWLREGMEEMRVQHPLNYRLLYGHYMEGRRAKDLAKEEGLSVNAVYQRLRWARAWLRKRMTEGGDYGSLP